LFNTGDVLTAAQVNTYLNEQTVMVFASSAARTSALSGVLAEGMMSYLQDTNAVEVYNGTAWVGVGNVGDITEVQAGVGISVASGTGPIPVITNSSTDLITTAGDILYGTAADTVARLGIGTAGKVLKVNSGATAPEWAVDPTTDVVTTAGDLIYGTGADAVTRLGIGTAGQVLKVNSGATAPEWGAAAGSGALTKIAAGSFATESSVAVDNVFSSTYTRYMALLRVQGSTSGPDLEIQYRYAGPTTQTTDYYGSGFSQDRANAQVNFGYVNGTVAILGDNLQVVPSAVTVFFDKVGNSSQNPLHWGNGYQEYQQGLVSFAGYQDTQRTYTGFLIKPSSGTITGSYVVYGLEK
jgi:hypothetical protein